MNHSRTTQPDGFSVIDLRCPHNQQCSTQKCRTSGTLNAVISVLPASARASGTFIFMHSFCALFASSAHRGTLFWCNGYSRRLRHFFQEMLLLCHLKIGVCCRGSAVVDWWCPSEDLRVHRYCVVRSFISGSIFNIIRI